jgi:glycosyltransferase involved in cell wall biosynthesis
MTSVLSRRLSIILPAYNEKATVAALLDKVLALPLPAIEKEIIAIESNSTDGTREIIRRYESEGKLKALYQDKPLGKGSAVRAGLAAATGDWILIQDADLEYDPADYPKLLAPLQSGAVSFVLGSRHLGHRDWRYRRNGTARRIGWVIDCGAWVYTQLFNALYKTRLTDPCTMYKVFLRTCLEGVHLQSNGFELDLEIVGKLVRRGFMPVEVPVSYESRNFEQGKKVRIWRDGWRVLKAIIQFSAGPL